MEHRQYTRNATNKKQRNKNTYFADDHVITAESEILLQKSIRRLESIVTKYGLTILASKTNTVAFKGRDPIGSKIVINNKIIK
jgi:hypothetical protein